MEANARRRMGNSVAFARQDSGGLDVRNVWPIPDARDFAMKGPGNAHAPRGKGDNSVRKVRTTAGKERDRETVDFNCGEDIPKGVDPWIYLNEKIIYS
jgi:hypothetical protein